jgi:iron complex transport system substrate-binding protein
MAAFASGWVNRTDRDVNMPGGTVVPPGGSLLKPSFFPSRKAWKDLRQTRLKSAGRCGFALTALCIAFVATSAPAAPRRAVSLNLCTDDLLLLLARPDQIASISYLSRDPRESALWRMARLHPFNDGGFLSIAALRPDLVIVMGGGPRDRATLASRIGARLLDLPYPQTLADLQSGIRAVAAALGRVPEGEALAARIEAARRSAPAEARDSIFLTGGGRTLPASGMGAEWLRLAGLRQRALPGDRISIENLLRQPPRLLIRSNYRLGETSREGAWLDHPALRDIPRARTIATDGRRWTCMGPSLLPEILRLRAAAR